MTRFLTEEHSKLTEDATNVKTISAVETWNYSKFLCWNYILNYFVGSLYIVYNKKTAKKLWESIDWKYKQEDARAKKFIIGWFLDYKMVDSKIMISKVQELQMICMKFT